VTVSHLQSYMPHGQELMELANDRMWKSCDSCYRSVHVNEPKIRYFWLSDVACRSDFLAVIVNNHSAWCSYHVCKVICPMVKSWWSWLMIACGNPVIPGWGRGVEWMVQFQCFIHLIESFIHLIDSFIDLTNSLIVV
jgi:hypothetical protein